MIQHQLLKHALSDHRCRRRHLVAVEGEGRGADSRLICDRDGRPDLTAFLLREAPLGLPGPQENPGLRSHRSPAILTPAATSTAKSMTFITSQEFGVDAVLKAADEWVSAQEALLAAQQAGKETEAEREAVDIAGSRLVVAVTRWRSSRRR